ncbi:unnamed protein product [Fraxinus pennsylvanica]|uniref:Uncharacterized protein n=1 Tax=Fraxinus pennsylvanica TaxID=56036 RepID=A0AAD2E747_9LAMI|nr:unnamed protein product [Fraxinus pennsylvanica]
MVYLWQVDAHVKELKTLCKRKALHSKEADSLVMKWAHQLLSKDSYLLKITDANKDIPFLTPQTGAIGKELDCCICIHIRIMGHYCFDDSEKIRQLADFLFGNILKAKAPLLAYNSFVVAIFVLIDCNVHTGQVVMRIQGLEGCTFIPWLKQMAPEHLLATFTKVCAEILAAASDVMLSLEDVTGQSVLQDAFIILSSKEIKIQSNRVSSSEAADVEEEGGDNGGALAKGRAITQADYKNEIDDLLVADQQLQKELV